MEDITDIDYRHAKRVFKELNIKYLGEYYDLYVQRDTFLLANAFENFRNKFIKRYELDPASFLSAPGLAWQPCLKKTGIKLEETKVEIFNAIHRYGKASNKYMKNYDKNKGSSYITYLNAKGLYGWAICQNCL